MDLYGRKQIYTDEPFINETNVLAVLNDALITHDGNASEMQFLLQYEKGYQPLQRDKTVRPDIDVKVVDNVANEVTEFKLGFNWGSPILYVQHGSNESEVDSEEVEDNAISLLSQMFKSENKNSKDQELARYIEICGLGYRYFKMKSRFDGESVFDMATLNPLYTFIVYSNDAFKRKMMAVTIRQMKSGTRYFTCITENTRFEIQDQVKIINGEESVVRDEKGNIIRRISNGGNRMGEKNPFGIIPIVEYRRSHDLTGCFERQLSDMDNLNILVSDFTNDVSQTTQAFWWANDVDFPTDEDGVVQKVKAGQWICSNTNPNGSKPMINALGMDFDYNGILEDIKYRHARILQKCDVPATADNSGGSTGTAMSMSTGWQDADCSANKESQIIESSEYESIRIVKAIIDISTDIDEESPLKKLKVSDIDIKFVRNKSYDMATKANTFATLIRNGIHGRDAMQVADIGGDIEQIWINSKEDIEKLQETLFEPKELSASASASDTGSERTMQDSSDQTENSPILSS